MEKPIEELIVRFEKNIKQQELILKEQEEIARELRDRPQEDWDWVSVNTACKQWNISLCKMYSKINAGKIKTKKFDNKTYVSLSEVRAIDDKVAE